MTVTIENTYTGNGSTTDYSFTFPYLDTSDIKVSVGGSDTTAYSLHNATTVRFDSAPANSAVIRIYRSTSYDSPKATFYPGSAIRAGDLNDNSLQNLYVTQEANVDILNSWKTGDPTVDSSETWYTTDDTKVATSKAIENRINSQIDTALEGDVLVGTDLAKSASSGQVTISHNVSGANSTVNNSNGNVLQDITISAQGHVTSIGSVDLDGRYYTETEADTNFQPKDAELTELATMGSTTAAALADLTQAEVQILDGATVTTAELNILDGVTATATELNTLDGITSTTAELNILDGVTATANELNKTDGLTATPTELNALDGITSNTTELNKLDGVTASTAELNIVSGKTFRASGDGTLTTTSDTEIPSSKVIASHVSSTILATGGFISINNEVSFPVTASQPANGVIVSISDAAGTVVNGSGTSTTGRTTDGTPATVTINNFPSSLYGETLATGVGMLVTSTGSSNIYNYHKILAAEADVKSLSDDINDFNARYRIASSAPGSNNDEGDLYFDTSADKMKVYNGSSWDDVASVGSFFINTLSSSSSTGGGSATFNGSAYRFTLSNPATGGAQQLIVSVNGVIQKPNSGTSQPSEGFAIDGNDIIFSAAPASGSDFFIVTQGSSVSIGTPSAASVNSTHIIDGSIVNGDISSSADIAGSKIADDSITEAKLDIHNAPSGTDKFLKYTSNGMEWAVDNNTVYTHPNHTGEVTSSADGAQTIADNVVDEANLKVSNSPTNGYFLSAQSGDTGGLTWAEVSAAPTVDGTASGAIAINKPVVVNTDGTLSQVSSSALSEAVDGSTYEFEDSNCGIPNVCYDVGNGKYVIVFTSGSEGHAIVASVSGTTISYGTAAAFETGFAPNQYSVCYEADSGKVVIAYSHQDTKVYAKVGTVSGTSITFGSRLTVKTTESKAVLVAADGTGKVLFLYYINDNSTECVMASISGTTLSKGTAVSLTSEIGGESSTAMTSGMGYGLCYHEDVGKFVAVSKNGASVFRAVAITKPASGNDCTKSGYYDLDNNCGDGWVDVCYDTKNKQCIGVFSNGGDSGDGYAIAFNVSSNDGFSKGTAVEFNSDDDCDNNRVTYDQAVDKILIIGRSVNSQQYGKYTVGTASGTTLTFETPAVYAGNNASDGLHNIPKIQPAELEGKVMIVYRNPQDSSHGHAKTFQFAYTSSTLKSGNFIGFSKAAYSDTNTATINVVGNTSTQSSLTPGSKYYVQIDGTLSKTADSRHTVEAGTALSATKLLIK